MSEPKTRINNMGEYDNIYPQARTGRYQEPISASKDRKRRAYYSVRIQKERRAANKPLRHRMHDEKMVAMGVSSAAPITKVFVEKPDGSWTSAKSHGGGGNIILVEQDTSPRKLKKLQEQPSSAGPVSRQVTCRSCCQQEETTWHNPRTFRCKECFIAGLVRARLAKKAEAKRGKRLIWERYIRKYKKGKKAKAKLREHTKDGKVLDVEGNLIPINSLANGGYRRPRGPFGYGS